MVIHIKSFHLQHDSYVHVSMGVARNISSCAIRGRELWAQPASG
jgi:hypothetical protein